VCPVGLEERTSSGGGTYQSQIDYDSIAGHLIGWSNGTSETYDLTDALGSVVLSFSAGAILGEQLSGPYGNQRYIEGTLGTDKGYTGQFVDAVTELDYYNARWYDPVSGRFLSPDSVQGNMLGFDPYAYVSCNPETMNDPTGHWGWFAAIAVAVAVVAVVAAPVLIAAGAVAAADAGAAASAAAVTSAAIEARAAEATVGVSGACLESGAYYAGAAAYSAAQTVGWGVTAASAASVGGQFFYDATHGRVPSLGDIGSAAIGGGFGQLANDIPGVSQLNSAAEQDQQAALRSQIDAQATTIAQLQQQNAQLQQQQEEQEEDRHNSWVKEEKQKIASSHTSLMRSADRRWESVYASIYHTRDFTSAAAISDRMMYEDQVNDFVRQESNLFLRPE